MKRGLTRKNKGTLFCYASGDGALHFCWNTYDYERGGFVANGSTVTVADAKAYLKLKEAKHLRDRGWRVITLHGQVVLVADVKRTGDDTLTYDGTEYRYTYGEHKLYTDGCDALRNYHYLTLTTVVDGKTIQVGNLSTLSAINHYLSYEDAILAASLVADRAFVLPERASA